MSSTPRTVLVVDDDEDQHVICDALLRHAGYEVLHAPDGAAGVRVARDEHPDVILMDIRMPRMDGFAAARALRAAPDTARIPLIAVTASVIDPAEPGGLRTVEALRAHGFTGYLTKPCETAAILTAVRAALRAAP